MNHNHDIKHIHTLIDKAEQVLKERKGECTDCKYYSSKFLSSSRQSCKNPAIVLISQTRPQGYDRKAFLEVDYQRSDSSYNGRSICKPEGILFEPREGLFGLVGKLKDIVLRVMSFLTKHERTAKD